LYLFFLLLRFGYLLNTSEPRLLGYLKTLFQLQRL
jgi:hypothetical protein